MRLRSSRDIRRVLKSGRRVGGESFVVYVDKGKEEVGRVAIVVGKKVGRAVLRNRVKRWCREYFRTRQLWRLGVDMIIRVVKPVYSYREVEREISYLLRKVSRR